MGNGTSWSDPNNWSGQALPTAADDVTIDVASPLTITHATGTDTVHSLTTNSQVNLNLSGGSITTHANSLIFGGFANSGSLTVAGGEVEFFDGATSTGGQFQVYSGADLIFGHGPVSLDAATGILSVGTVLLYSTGGTPIVLDGHFYNSGETRIESDVVFNESFAAGTGNTIGSQLDVANGTATFTEGGDFSFKNLTIDGTLSGPTDPDASPMSITVSGSLAIDSGTLLGAGTLTVTADAASQITGSVELNGWTLVQLANVSWTGMGDGTSWSDPNNWSNGALPTSADNVTINVASPLTVAHASGTDTVRSLTTNSQVSLNLSGGSLTTLANSLIFGGFANSGSLVVAGGEIEFFDGATSTGGQFVVDSGADLIFGYGVVSFDAASGIISTGVIGLYSTGGMPIVLDGTFDNSGYTDISSDVVFNESFAVGSGNQIGYGLQLDGGTATFTEGGDFTFETLSFGTGATLSGPTDPDASPMSITVTNSLAGGGSFILNGGTLLGAGTLTVAADATSEIQGSDELDGWTLDLLGTTEVSSQGPNFTYIPVYFAFADGAQWINGGAMTIVSPQFVASGRGSFFNTGTLRTDSGTITTETNDGTVTVPTVAGISFVASGFAIGIPSFNNSGTVIVQSGDLQLGGAVTTDAPTPGDAGPSDAQPSDSQASSITVDSGTALYLTGSITTAVVDSLVVITGGQVYYFLTGGSEGAVKVINSNTGVVIGFSLAGPISLQSDGGTDPFEVSKLLTTPVVLIGNVSIDTGGQLVNFGGGISENGTANTGMPVLMVTLTSNGASGSVEFSGSAEGQSLPGNIEVTGGTLEFATPVSQVVNKPTSVTVSGTGALELTGSVSVFNSSVNVTNSGTSASGLVVSGLNQIVGAINGLGNLVVGIAGAAASLIATSIDQNSLVIGAGSTLTIAASPAGGNPLIGSQSSASLAANESPAVVAAIAQRLAAIRARRLAEEAAASSIVSSASGSVDPSSHTAAQAVAVADQPSPAPIESLSTTEIPSAQPTMAPISQTHGLSQSAPTTNSEDVSQSPGLAAAATLIVSNKNGSPAASCTALFPIPLVASRTSGDPKPTQSDSTGRIAISGSYELPPNAGNRRASSVGARESPWIAANLPESGVADDASLATVSTATDRAYRSDAAVGDSGSIALAIDEPCGMATLDDAILDVLVQNVMSR